MAGDQHRLRESGPAQVVDDPGLLAAGDEVVDEHADPALRARAELAHPLDQVVDAVQRLDHDALDAQVVAPDALQQRRVVHALDPDPAGPRHPGRGVGHGVGAGRGPARRGCGRRGAAAGRTSVTGGPSSRNEAGSIGNTRRLPCRSSSVTVSRFSPLSTAWPSSTTAPQNAPSARLDDQVGLGGHLRHLRRRGAGFARTSL